MVWKMLSLERESKKLVQELLILALSINYENLKRVGPVSKLTGRHKF